MLRQRTRGLTLLHCVSQIALAEGLYSAWACLPFGLVVDRRLSSISNYAIYGALVAVALAADGMRGISKRLPLLEIGAGELLRRSARQTFTVLILLLLYLVAAKDDIISRLFLFTFLHALFAVLFVSNRYLPALIASFAFPARHRHRMLVVGDEAKTKAIRGWLERKRRMGIEAIEFHPIQEIATLEEHLVRSKARQLLLLGHPRTSQEIEHYTQCCDRLGIRFLILSDWQERVGRPLRVTDDEGLQFLSFQQDLLECPINRAAKRAFDVAVSVPVCFFILPPLALLVWILHRFQSPGPLFFRQYRTGVNGVPFRIIKFRTMRVDSGDERVQATSADVRVFPAGRWLRRFSLDEIPQFLNALKGEMSVVGPRPHLGAHDDEFAKAAAAYRLRHMIKPGITGLAQVSGWRGETRTSADVVRRAEADVLYAEQWSLRLDSQIVLRTVWQMFSPPSGAV